MTFDIEDADLMQRDAMEIRADGMTIDHHSEVLLFGHNLQVESRAVTQVVNVAVFLLTAPVTASPRIEDHFSAMNFGSDLKSDVGVFLRVMSDFVAGVQIDLKLVAVMRNVTVHLNDCSRTHPFRDVTPIGDRWTVDYLHIGVDQTMVAIEH